jgi:hypothetical protein
VDEALQVVTCGNFSVLRSFLAESQTMLITNVVEVAPAKSGDGADPGRREDHHGDDGPVAKADDMRIVDGTGVRFESEAGARILVLSGEPIGEPGVGQGPFVMNTREETAQAVRDYQNGRVG